MFFLDRSRIASDRGRQGILNELATRLLAPELRCARGEERLWKAFWVYGVGVNLLLAGAYAQAVLIDAFLLQQALLFACLAYTPWVLVCVWRCAPNTRHPLWCQLARSLTLVWGANALLLAFFLEADLIGHYVAG